MPYDISETSVNNGMKKDRSKRFKERGIYIFILENIKRNHEQKVSNKENSE